MARPIWSCFFKFLCNLIQSYTKQKASFQGVAAGDDENDFVDEDNFDD